jgi:hypothetical protein
MFAHFKKKNIPAVTKIIKPIGYFYTNLTDGLEKIKSFLN